LSAVGSRVARSGGRGRIRSSTALVHTGSDLGEDYLIHGVRLNLYGRNVDVLGLGWGWSTTLPVISQYQLGPVELRGTGFH
jgi:hypothetical protein